MLKAVYHDQYRKRDKRGNPVLMYKYTVTGPLVEVQEYLTVQSGIIGKTPDEWAKAENGNPLFFLNVTALEQQGRLPKLSFILQKNYDGSRYFPEVAKAELAGMEQREARIEARMDDYMAQLRLGIIRVAAPVPNNTVPTGQPTALPQPAAQPDLLDGAIANMGANPIANELIHDDEGLGG